MQVPLPDGQLWCDGLHPPGAVIMYRMPVYFVCATVPSSPPSPQMFLAMLMHKHECLIINTTVAPMVLKHLLKGFVNLYLPNTPKLASFVAKRNKRFMSLVSFEAKPPMYKTC